MPLLWQKSNACIAYESAFAVLVARKTNLQKLEDVISHVVVHEFWVETSKVRIVDILEDQGRRLALAVPDDIQQRNHVGSSAEVLQDLDLPLDLFLFNRLEHLYYALLIIHNIYSLKDFRVFAPA